MHIFIALFSSAAFASDSVEEEEKAEDVDDDSDGDESGVAQRRANNANAGVVVFIRVAGETATTRAKRRDSSMRTMGASETVCQ
jgi:hypothetical protein